jgi:hypothetical protein
MKQCVATNKEGKATKKYKAMFVANEDVTDSYNGGNGSRVSIKT